MTDEGSLGRDVQDAWWLNWASSKYMNSSTGHMFLPMICRSKGGVRRVRREREKNCSSRAYPRTASKAIFV